MTFALYPNRIQAARLFHFLRAGRLIFNRCLEARKHWYAHTGKMISYYEHCADLTELRNADPAWADIPLEILRNGCYRLDFAYRQFFGRLRKGNKKVGFPRFKSVARWNSLTINRPKRIIINNRVHVFGVDGLIRARNVRPIEGKAKQLRIVHRAGRWFAKVVVDDGRSLPPKVSVKSAIGIDLGLTCFAALSNGERVENPRFGEVMARKLRAANRSMARKQKGSNRRRKAIRRLQRVHAHLAAMRGNFIHHAAKKIVADHQLIAVEELDVAGLVRGRLARSIRDACWSKFLWGLTYRAERAGCQIVRVDPAGTSQECSACGAVVRKGLSVRVHRCPCGCVLDRDLNAARNVLKRAQTQLSVPPPDRGWRNARGGMDLCGRHKSSISPSCEARSL